MRWRHWIQTKRGAFAFLREPVKIQAGIQRKAKAPISSSFSDDIVRAAHLTPCHDITAAVEECFQSDPNGARVAALPQGPFTIPYLA
jgi:hypothetical protein